MKNERFNQRAHESLTELVYRSKEKLKINNSWNDRQVDEALVDDYIYECSSFIAHATVYLPSEAIIAADLFISKLVDFSGFKLTQKIVRECAYQLSFHTNLYFPSFYYLLSNNYLKILHTSKDLSKENKNGVLMLAATTIPGARAYIRNMFHHQRYEYETVPVQDLRLRLNALLTAISFE